MLEEFRTAEDMMTSGNVYDKIEDAKKYFMDSGITKTGKNNYQGFKYLECSDIFPVVREICEVYNMKTRFDFTENTGLLFITDNEDKSVASYSIPLAPVTDTDPNKHMQNIGKIRTYAMRYLYIQAFEIAVPDEIDRNSKGKNQRKFSPKKVQKNTQKSVSSYPAENNRNIHDLARSIAEEMNNQGIPDTTTNAKEFIRQKRVNGQITPLEYKLLKEKLGGATV